MTAISSLPAYGQSSDRPTLTSSLVYTGRTRRPQIEVTSLTAREFQLPLRDGTIRVRSDGEGPDWLNSTLNQLQVLAELHENWDSHGSSPITKESVSAALHFLEQHLPSGAKEPTIVPTSAGGLQLEWHRLAGDLEVNITSEGAIAAYFCSATSDEEWEMEFGSVDFRHLAKALDIVAAEASAAR